MRQKPRLAMQPAGGEPVGSTRLLAAILALTAIAPLLFIGARSARSPDVAFLTNDAGAGWIMLPLPMRPSAIRTEPDRPLWFARSFEVEDASGSWTLQVKAMRDFEVRLNGATLALGGPPSGNWKRTSRLEVGAHVRPGTNRLEVAVRNAAGPRLLWLRLAGGTESVASDESWQVSLDGRRYVDAVLADDRRPLPAASETPTTVSVLRASGARLLAYFALMLGLVAAAGRLSSRWPAAARRLPALALATVACGWLVLFVSSFWQQSHEVGYDAVGHLEYVRLVSAGHAAPLAIDGSNTYHPPLFYWLSAAALRGLGDELGQKSLKLLPFLSGLANVVLAWLLARTLLPHGSRAVVFATLFAGLLPMNLYMAAYVSNESWNGALTAGAILATVRYLLADAARWWHAAALGALLGLALLSKFTALALLPWVFLFLAYKLLWIERASWPRAAGHVGLGLLCVCLGAGWFYLRNLQVFGQPLVFNWEVGTAEGSWWQQPGFHTSGYFLGFGASLERPFLSGLHSLGDGLYSTLWGDGYLGGMIGWRHRPAAWDWELMTAGYVLALPMTGVLALGCARLLAAALRHSDPRRRAAAGFLACTLLVFAYAAVDYSLRAPMYSAVKAFFALGLLGPLAVAAACGWEAVERALRGRRWLAARLVARAWAATLALVVYLTYLGP